MANTNEYSGSQVSYYTVVVPVPSSLPVSYRAECLDIIETLNMNFAEGEAFKAIWRRAAARLPGARKRGHEAELYDAQKVQFYGCRMVAKSSRR